MLKQNYFDAINSKRHFATLELGWLRTTLYAPTSSLFNLKAFANQFLPASNRTHSSNKWYKSSQMPQLSQFGESVFLIMKLNLLHGMCPDLSLWAVTVSFLFNSVFAHQGICGGWHWMVLYHIPFSNEHLLKYSFQFSKHICLYIGMNSE